MAGKLTEKLVRQVVQAERPSGTWNENTSGNMWQIKHIQLGLQESKEICARLMRAAFEITWNPHGFSLRTS